MPRRATIITIGQCWKDKDGLWIVTGWNMDCSSSNVPFIDGQALCGWPFEELAWISQHRGTFAKTGQTSWQH